MAYPIADLLLSLFLLALKEHDDQHRLQLELLLVTPTVSNHAFHSTRPETSRLLPESLRGRLLHPLYERSLCTRFQIVKTILQRPPRRRPVLRRLRRAVDVPAVPQDGRRADASPRSTRPSPIPAGYDWPALADRGRRCLEAHYRHTLEELGKQPGMLGVIFRKAQNKIQDPAKLRRLIVDLIDKEQWSTPRRRRKGRRLRGPAGEERRGRQRRAPASTSPRAPLIAAMVDVMRPAARRDDLRPGLRHRRFPARRPRYIAKHYAASTATRSGTSKAATLFGVELVDSVTRLCAMNLFLHGIGGEDDDRPPGQDRRRACRQAPGRIRHRPDQPAVRQEIERHHRQRGGREQQGEP